MPLIEPEPPTTCPRGMRNRAAVQMRLRRRHETPVERGRADRRADRRRDMNERDGCRAGPPRSAQRARRAARRGGSPARSQPFPPRRRCSRTLRHRAPSSANSPQIYKCRATLDERAFDAACTTRQPSEEWTKKPSIAGRLRKKIFGKNNRAAFLELLGGLPGVTGQLAGGRYARAPAGANRRTRNEWDRA